MASSLTLISKARRFRRLREEVAELRAELRAEKLRSQGSTELPGLGDLPLVELIPRLSPGTSPPTHLGPLVDELELAIAPHQGQRFFWFSVPPRHWKTTTLVHAAVKHILRWPGQKVGYLSHTAKFAQLQSKEARRIVERLGLKFRRDTNTQSEWDLTTGAGLVARGLDGDITGRGFRLLLIDDPIKSREQAESAVEREKIFQSIEEDAITRLAPDGCAFLVHTRWHPDDPIGRYKRRDGWRGVNLKALDGPEENEARLLPELWTREFFEQLRRTNVYKFSALYQGEPRPRGGARFNEPAKFEWHDRWLEQLGGYKVAYGVDLAYTAKTHADFSVCLKLLRVDGKTPEDTRWYVADVRRAQVDAPSFTLTLKSAHAKEPGPMLWLCSGTEKGAAQFVQQKVDAFETKAASVDKFQRSEAVAEAWNAGKVLVPGGDDRPDWVDDFVDELTHFTGVKDAHDDQVDALAAAYDLLSDDGDGELLLGGSTSGRGWMTPRR